MIYIFDLDGTLTDTNHLWADVDKEFLARRGLVVTEEYVKEIVRCTFPSAAALTKRLYGIPDTPEDIMAEWEALSARHYGELAPLKPGAEALVRQCAREGIPMAVFTACRPALCRAALARFGLLELFQRLVFAEELTHEKWDPRCFAELCALLETEPGDCVFFDDNPENCTAAAQAGLHTVGVYDAHFAEQQDKLQTNSERYVYSLEELLQGGAAPLTPASL